MIHRLYEKRKSKKDSGAQPRRTGEGKYLKSIVYGGLDGIITTFAVVTGVAGASLSPKVILILGSANLFADGIAMAFGDYLSTKAENEFHANQRTKEEHQLEIDPEEESASLIQRYEEKGLTRPDAENLVGILCKYPKAMVDTVMVEELGILEDDESPLGNALATLSSFVFFGSFPLSIYVLPGLRDHHSFLFACLITGITLFTLGAVKARITSRNRTISGLEMLIIGGIAATVAFGIGALLEGLLPG